MRGDGVGGPAAACLNCGAPLTGRYCSACGQENRPAAPTLRDVLGDAWEAITNLEGRILQSLGLLFFFPGFLTLEYFAGRRARWVSPVRLYLVVSVAYFGLMSLTGWGGFDFDIDITGETTADTRGELEQRGFETEEELALAAQDAVGTWIPRAMFLLVPIFTALVAFARRPSHRTYPEHMVFALHVHAAWFWGFAMASVAGGIVENAAVDSIVTALSIGYALWYLIVALRVVYGGSLAANVFSGVVLGATYWMITIGVTLAILLPVVFVSRR
ncbi:MAG TPA: DUF3667 domain-containing protein [Gemmatimonadaceae bacterium]|nr:DUF3667 domain-containing protein [Gemmatimonadaceae bacterium]